MPSPRALDVRLLCGARALLQAHGRELPQRDDLCGAFCGSLALAAAAVGEHDGGPVDQDAVARAARTTVSRVADGGSLPRGEHGRRDYRLAPPLIDDPSRSGTTAAGLVGALTALSDEAVAPIPLAGPWTGAALAGVFDSAASLERPVTLIANVATRHLWGAGASLAQVLDQLAGDGPAGPEPDWDVGHFVCVIGCVSGPVGRLYVVADTYPSLGRGGVHVQPQERMAEALARPGMAAGGLMVVAHTDDAAAVREAAAALGLLEEAWDNGSVMAGAPA